MTAPASPPAPADATASPDAAPAAPAGGRSVPLALVLAVLVGLAVGLGAGFFAAGPALATGIAPAVAATARHARAAHPAKAARGAAAGEDAADDDETAVDDEEAGGDEGSGDDPPAKGEHGDKAAGAPVYTLTDLVLNPAESGGTRFLLLTIAFELKNQETHDAMKARDAELRDHVLATIGNKTVDQLSNVAARDSLKVELKAVAAGLFRKKAVRRVYFPQFVIQ